MCELSPAPGLQMNGGSATCYHRWPWKGAKSLPPPALPQGVGGVRVVWDKGTVGTPVYSTSAADPAAP